MLLVVPNAKIKNKKTIYIEFIVLLRKNKKVRSIYIEILTIFLLIIIMLLKSSKFK